MVREVVMQGIKYVLRIFVFALFTAVGFSATAQGELYIFGVVKDYADSKKLSGVKITAYQNGSQVDVYTTSGNGKYEFFLDLGQEYEVTFEKKGLVSKKVYMDSRNIPEEDIGAGFSMNIEMSLFEEVEGLDITILEQPIGKAKYNPNTGALEFDFAYTQKIKDELNRLMRNWEKGTKDQTAKKEAEQKELEKLEKEFSKLVADADDDFLKEDFQSSVAGYKEALKLKPGNPMVQMKLDSAEEKLAEQSAANKEQKQYDEALQAGDDFMRSEEYQKAIAKYEEALAIRPDEKYPADQIADATKKLEDIAKREAENKAFNDLVAKGDNLVKALDYDGAIGKYEEALNLRSDEEVEAKLQAVRDAKADFEAQRAKDAEYEAHIAQADNKFKAADYEASIELYQAALGVKPDEEYPAQKIAEANAKIQELAEAAEEAERKKELEDQFNALLAAGDELMTQAAYESAIGKFEEALGLMPKSERAQKKLDAAREQMAQANAQAAKDEQYAALIEQADASFAADELEAALTGFQEASAVKPSETYPTNKIKEIERLIAERKQIAEEKRLEEERAKAEEKRLAEELAQFNSMVESGDEYFSQKEYQKAIDHYQEATKLKPENKHLPNKIAQAQDLLEQMRANQDRDQNYQEAIAEGDRKFKGQNYEGAIEAFERAQELKPDELYPPEQIAAAREGIAALEKAEAAAALEAQQQAEAAEQQAKEEEKAALRNEFNRIVALGDALMDEKEYKNAKVRYTEALELIPDDEPVLAKLQEADRLLRSMLESREIDKAYNMIIADADAAYKVEDYEVALGKYREALGVIPADEYATQRIATIEDLLAEQRAQAAKEQEAELEAQRLQAEAEERARKQREKEQQSAQIDDEYNTFIEVADRKMKSEDYDLAVRNYQQALGVKPDEYYPKSKIREIELLLEKRAAQKAEEERLTALEMEQKKGKESRRHAGSTVDSQTEDEAEKFMREARLREEAEKYERIKRLKEEQQEKLLANRESESERSSSYREQVAVFRQRTEDRYASATSANNEVAERMKNYKEAVEKDQSKYRDREQQEVERATQKVEQTTVQLQELSEQGEEVRSKSIDNLEQETSVYQKQKAAQREKEDERTEVAYQQVQEVEEQIQQTNERFSERQEDLTQEVMQQKEMHQQYVAEQQQEQFESIEQVQQQINQQKEREQGRSALQEKAVEESTAEIQAKKEQAASREKHLSELAAIRAQKARAEAYKKQATGTKSYDDYYLSQLAQEYPQGVTEESDNVGNKVVIRRIVVMGNKADEYRKVIDKTGKFYFKNGRSISERTWNSETNPSYD